MPSQPNAGHNITLPDMQGTMPHSRGRPDNNGGPALEWCSIETHEQPTLGAGLGQAAGLTEATCVASMLEGREEKAKHKQERL